MGTNRQYLKEAFLEMAGWASAIRTPIIGDASTRSYERLSNAHAHAILMDAPVASEAASCPHNATQSQREALGYNALARLAGPNLTAFTTLADSLRQAGLHAPEIYAADPVNGFALLEDLGGQSYAAAILQGADEAQLYHLAVDALVQLSKNFTRPATTAVYKLLAYDAIALHAEADLLLDWYWPFTRDEALPVDAKTSWRAAWAVCLKGLSEPETMVLRDYHAENLLWMPEATALDRVGVIDFQDGLWGHAAYDLVSLLEDARRDVPAALAQSLITYYKDHISKEDHVSFDRDYAILATQRNAKILGVFARLVVRDNKPHYESLLPRVSGYFAMDLERDAVAPVRQWFVEYMPECLNK